MLALRGWGADQLLAFLPRDPNLNRVLLSRAPRGEDYDLRLRLQLR
jgi:hypothetical protein